MNALEKRNKVIEIYKNCIGRNIYSQDAKKRECAYTPYSDGNYYSDCSSSVRLAYKKANIGLNNIGGNTVGMYNSKLGKTIKCNIIDGVPKDISALRVGDILLFAGSDSSRKNSEYVGHVEMIYSISENNVKLCGHGSGNPTVKDMKDYCKNRQKSKTSTSRGNKGLICVKRFIEDDESCVSTIEEYTEIEHIIWELNHRKIITDIDLWRDELSKNDNYYWLARKMVHYIRTKKQGETANNVYENPEEIIWELQNRNIITDIDLWRKEIQIGTNIYWLALKGVHYIRTY